MANELVLAPRLLPALATASIVVATASAVRCEEENALAVGYVAKPIDTDIFPGIIASHAMKARGAAS